MSRHRVSLRNTDLFHPPGLTVDRQADPVRDRRLVLVRGASALHFEPSWGGMAGGVAEDIGESSLAQAIRRVMRAVSIWRRSRRAPVLHVESLSEHLRRDLGLTNHVEQPMPGRRWEWASHHDGGKTRISVQIARR